MKFLEYTNKSILVLVIFVLYLILPVSTPSIMSPYIESPMGLLLIFGLTISLFIYSHPILGVLFIFVAYTLLRRSSTVKNSAHYVQYTKSDSEKRMEAEKQVEEATPNEEPRNIDVGGSQPITLEEEIVQERAPIGRSGRWHLGPLHGLRSLLNHRQTLCLQREYHVQNVHQQ